MNTEPYLLAALAVTLSLLLGYGVSLWWRSCQLDRRQLGSPTPTVEKPDETSKDSMRGHSR